MYNECTRNRFRLHRATILILLLSPCFNFQDPVRLFSCSDSRLINSFYKLPRDDSFFFSSTYLRLQPIDSLRSRCTLKPIVHSCHASAYTQNSTCVSLIYSYAHFASKSNFDSERPLGLFRSISSVRIHNRNERDWPFKVIDDTTLSIVRLFHRFRLSFFRSLAGRRRAAYPSRAEMHRNESWPTCNSYTWKWFRTAT